MTCSPHPQTSARETSSSGQVKRPTHFYIHRAILSIFSTVFKEVFSLHQSPNQNDPTPTIPIINIPCSPKTLSAVLRFGRVFPLYSLPWMDGFRLHLVYHSHSGII